MRKEKSEADWEDMTVSDEVACGALVMPKGQRVYLLRLRGRRPRKGEVERVEETWVLTIEGMGILAATLMAAALEAGDGDAMAVAFGENAGYTADQVHEHLRAVNGVLTELDEEHRRGYL